MGWFNYYGLIIIAIIMVPNIIFAIKNKEAFANTYKNRAVEIMEQVGRYGCLVLMIFNVPYTYFDFWFDCALVAYLTANGVLCLLYIVFWIVCWNRNGKLKALSLSIIPSVVFLYSGVVIANIPLIVFAILFGVNHILLSYKNSMEYKSE